MDMSSVNIYMPNSSIQFIATNVSEDANNMQHKMCMHRAKAYFMYTFVSDVFYEFISERSVDMNKTDLNAA